MSYPQPFWKDVSLDERARYIARQGYGFLTADPVRVVYQPKDGEQAGELIDVPSDGKTIGEIVMRGNISMREVRGERDSWTSSWLLSDT